MTAETTGDLPLLVSHHLCPYVQRVAIAFSEKGMGYEPAWVDLADKPDWFLRLSPLGKVPLLKASDHVIFESAVIVEYLEETGPNPLHPADPLRRAEHRGWIEMASAILDGIARLYNAPDRDAFTDAAAALRERFTQVEARIHRRAAPWFDGAKFSLVDAAFGPVFRYFDTFDRIGDFGVLDGLPAVDAWRRALARRPSVAKAAGADYGARLADFLRRRGSYLASRMETVAA
jgi:glutathione S-transferase